MQSFYTIALSAAEDENGLIERIEFKLLLYQ
jgi:hypothetical protein